MPSTCLRYRSILLPSLLTAASLTMAAAQSQPATPPPTPSHAPKPPETDHGRHHPVPTMPTESEMQAKMDRFADVIAMAVGEAHGIKIWRNKPALQGDLTVELNGRKTLEATIICDANRDRVRMTLKDGMTFVYDGEKAWASPNSAADPAAKPTLLLWSSIVKAPFQLRDSDVVPRSYRTLPLRSRPFDTFKLEFLPNSSHSNADWRRIYVDQQKHTLYAIGNVPMLKFKDSEMKQCVVYEKTETVEGVVLPSEMILWNWNEDCKGEPIGKATLAGMKFIVPPEGTFEKQADAHEAN